MSLLDKFELHQTIIDCVDNYGFNPMGLEVEVRHSPTEGTVAGRAVVLAGTNNYLGLTFDPACIAAAVDAVEREGTGTTGSRMANGTYSGHKKLEAELADFYGVNHAIVFTTGYQANLGMISTVAGPGEFIILDADSHASIYDGARLSGAQMFRFRHNDVTDLDKRLSRLGEHASDALVVVEGLYSMLGDRAPLTAIAEVSARHGACLMVDEAHSMGLVGEHGRGQVEEQGVLDDVDFIVGTFSKSLGCVGGYCVSRHDKLDYIRNSIRAYIFTASATPSVIASARMALDIVRHRPQLRETLWKNARRVYDALKSLGFDVGPEASPVVAVMMDDVDSTVAAWNTLLDAGVYVNLVVPPAAPGKFGLLRCSLSAAHTDEQVDKIIEGYTLMHNIVGPARRIRA
jgi:8-amino-7-oxononanoate synthase